MPNIAAVLKSEISRLSSKVVRQQVNPVRSAAAAHRRQLAALKRQVQELERSVAALRRLAANGNGKASPDDRGEAKFRFTSKGLKTLRARHDLSAEDFGRLLEVGAQTIYNWENQKAAPRATQIPNIAALRKIGKREARRRLDSL